MGAAPSPGWWGAVVWLVLGCGGGAPGAPVRDGTTAAGLYHLRWRPIPEPIPVSTLFEVETTLTERSTGRPVEVGAVRVDATMPQHGHGMPTRPEADPGVCDPTGACRHPGGVYRMRGMKLHMPGEWVFRFEVTGPAGTDHLELVERL